MNRWVVGSTVALGLIAGACVFPEAEKIGGGGAGAGVSNGGAGGAGGGSTSGGGGTGGTGGALEEVVTIADVGAVSCVSGTSTQRHLIRTANGDYLALFFDEASPQDISVKRSDDGMRSWEDVDKLGLAPKLHDTQGANVGFDYASLPDGGVIHAAISVRDADGYYFELHGRATIDETGLPSWEAPQQMGSYALPVTDPPDGPATGITAAGVFDQTAFISPSGQGDYLIGFGPDTFASFSYELSFPPEYLGFGGTATHARAVFPLANVAVGVLDSNASLTEGHLQYWTADDGGLIDYASLATEGFHLRFAWGAVVAEGEAHVLRALTNHGFDHKAIDAGLNVVTGLPLPKNRALAPDAGVFLATGTAAGQITAFTIAEDFSIQASVFDGVGWSDWSEVEPPSELPRSCISGVATPDGEGRIALVWTEEDMSAFQLKGALVSP